jgi:RimJ/RimL family protein N-acetyltransferase
MQYRCSLEDMRQEYLPQHVAFLQDSDVRRYLRIRSEVTIEQQRAWLERVQRSSSDVLHAIIATDDRSFIGVAQLKDIDVFDRTANGGLVIGDKQRWGKGYATEARSLQLQYAFDHLRLRWVYGRTAACNIGAQRLMVANGYREIGRRPECRLIDGIFYDEYLYAVSREWWLAALAQ